MSRRAGLLLLMLVLIAAPVSAQDCGSGLPCGPLPWRLPDLPPLLSPTPFPTTVVTVIPPTSTGTITVTPTPSLTPTPTAPVDMAPINDQIGTLQHVVEATQETVFDRSPGFDLARNASNLFGYLLGLQTIHFGVFTPLIQFIFFALFFIIGIEITFWLLPLLASLVGVIRKLVGLVRDLIPI